MKIIPIQKHLFNIPEDITYLNCCYMSPQLLSVTRAGEKALLRKQEPWKINIDDFFVETEITRNLFAQLVDSNIDDIAIIPSASYGLAIAAKNLHVKANSKIVMLNEQFPSNVLVWKDTLMDISQRIGALLWSKMAFFKRAWWKVKVLLRI